MSDLQVLPGRERGVQQRGALALRSMHRGAETITSGTSILPLGVADVDGLVLERFFVVSGTVVVPDGANYYTFNCWIYRPNPEGGLTKVFMGTPRTTLATGIIPGLALRLHDEYSLNVAVPKGAAVGVDLAVTGTTATTARLILPVFQADLYTR